MDYSDIRSIKSQIITDIYIKNNTGIYTKKQFRAEKSEAYDNFKLKYINRKKSKHFWAKAAYAYTIPADIVTSPFQLLGFLHIIIFGLW